MSGKIEVAHSPALKYFNHAERFARDCKTLEASRDADWFREAAEDTYITLQSTAKYYKMLKETCRKHGVDYEKYAPCKFSYSNMQHLVSRNLPRESLTTVLADFCSLNLPVVGFFEPKAEQPPLAGPSRHEVRNQLETNFPCK